MKKQRLQFDFSQDAVEQLDELVGRVQASSRAEVIRRALMLLDFVVEAQEERGSVLVERTKDGKENAVRFLM